MFIWILLVVWAAGGALCMGMVKGNAVVHGKTPAIEHHLKSFALSWYGVGVLLGVLVQITHDQVQTEENNDEIV